MYTMHGCKNGNYVHLLYALLPGKSEVCHQQMWFLLFQLCEQRNLTLTPHSIHINFEQAMHYVMRVLPGTKSDCCRFHLGQNWWCKIQDLGLSTEYKEKTCNIRKCWVIICTTRTDWGMFCWGHLLFILQCVDLYYWCKFNILFVVQMKYDLWRKWKNFFWAQMKYQLSQKQCVGICIYKQ